MDGPQDTNAAPGADALFSCRVKGIPVPDITWLFHETIVLATELPSQGPVSARTRNKISFLNVSKVRTSDEGSVTCVATNRAGVGNMTADLAIRGETTLPCFIGLVNCR